MHAHNQPCGRWCKTTLVGLLLLLLTGVTIAEDNQSNGHDASKLFPRTYFLRALAAKDSTTRLAAIDRLEREYAGDPQAAEMLLYVLARIQDDARRQDMAYRLIRALTLFKQSEVTDYLVEALESSNFKIAMASLDVLVDRNETRTLRPILLLGNLPEFRSIYGFRIAVLDAAMSFRQLESIDFLVGKLPELDGHSEAIVFRYLSKISGKQFGYDKDEWTTWWAGVDKNKFKFNEEPVKNEEVIPVSRYSTPMYFGIEIHAKRIAFVVDKSKSMSESLNLVADTDEALPVRDSLETRLAKAKQELWTAIKELPADTHFNIVAFDDYVAAWQPRLVPANAQNKTRAFQFLSTIEAGGRTAWFDALDATFQMDGNLEAIFFLSDGLPTVGKIISSPEIVRKMTAENFFRRISIHTIGLGVNTIADRFLRSLAKENAGEYRSLGKREAVLIAAARPKLDVDKFAPERVIERPMPPITRVRPTSARAANGRLDGKELVLGVVVGDQARAYPINMLTGPNREIINDELGGKAIAATW